MKRSLYAGVAAWIAPALVVVAAEAPQPAKPAGKLKIETMVMDVGDVVRGQDAKATFLIENVGTDPVKILGVKPG